MLLGLFGYAQKWWSDSLVKQPNMAVGSDYRSLVNAYTDVRLVLEKGYTYPKFDGDFQFQHWAVTLWYRNDEANPTANFRLKEFSLRTLTNGYDSNAKPTPVDMDLEDISFQLLKLRLSQFKAIRDKGQDASTYIDEVVICYEVKDEDRLDVIYDDETLQSAIIAMRTRGEWRYDIYAFPKEAVCVYIHDDFSADRLKTPSTLSDNQSSNTPNKKRKATSQTLTPRKTKKHNGDLPGTPSRRVRPQR